MAAQAIGALAALIIITSPGSGLGTNIHQQFARSEAARIQRTTDREAGYAEAARIDSDAAAEYAAVVQAIAAQAAQRQYSAVQTAQGAATPSVTATRSGAPPPAPVAPTVIVSALSPPVTGSPLRTALAASSWPSALWAEVERIVQCESRGMLDPPHNNIHRGMLQVDPSLWGSVPGDMLGQLEQGWRIYQAQGLSAWACA